MSEPVAENREIDLYRRPEWRLIATSDGFGMVLESAGKVFAFPLERALAARIMAYFTNEEYTIFPEK